ncbi:MAG: CPBP family intramembrane metalloprotease [Solobacterium sp.]|nr:CPBP family intramembrane metalloprotease [Solobacterium sp.]
MKKFIRKTGTFTDIIVIAALAAFLIVLAGQLLGDALMNMLSTPNLQEENPALAISLQYLSFIGIWIVLALTLVFPKNRPMLKALRPNSTGNNLGGCLLGLLLGFGMNAFCVVMSILRKDIAISLWYVEPLKLFLIFLAVFIQSGAEELVCRWYLYQKLARRYRSPLVAFIGNAVFFTALHLANPGINIFGMAQIALIALLFSVMIYYYDCLWGAMLLHTAWNFTQNLIFGLPNSGIVSPYSLFHLDAASNGFFFNPGFGVEGSAGACVIITIVLIVMVVIAKKKNLKPVDIWAEQEAELEAKEAQAQA